jgi:hypothetical protein
MSLSLGAVGVRILLTGYSACNDELQAQDPQCPVGTVDAICGFSLFTSPDCGKCTATGITTNCSNCQWFLSTTAAAEGCVYVPRECVAQVP